MYNFKYQGIEKTPAIYALCILALVSSTSLQAAEDESHLKHEMTQTNSETEFSTNITDYIRERVVLKTIDYFPSFRLLDHTMCFSLDPYVEQKLPQKLIQKAIINEWNIEVHGIFPNLFLQHSKELGFDAIEHVPFKHNKRVKKYNYIRPHFFIGYKMNQRNTLIISVTPGEDYIYHYASIIRHYLHKLTRNAECKLTIHRYQALEQELSAWTGLDHHFVMPQDIVIMGNVEELQELFLKQRDLKFISRNESEYYGSVRYQLPNGKIINFLGVKFSYWGCISGKIVKKLCMLGVKEIIYSAKLGSMTKPDDLYEKIYSPTKYMTMKSHTVTRFITSLPNRFVQKFPEFDTNWHVSIPTVLEEDFEQRKAATQVGAQSIDNEISRIASAIEDHNKSQKKNVSFFTVHYATDYVRRKEENALEVPFDLSNNRSDAAVKGKKNVLEKISKYLLEYLLESE